MKRRDETAQVKKNRPNSPPPSGTVVKLTTMAHMRHRWGELVTTSGLPTLMEVMRRCGVSRDRIRSLKRDSEADTASSLDPLDSIDTWLSNQVHDPNVRRRILAGTAQCLQALRENAPLDLPAEPMNRMPLRGEYSELPEWHEFEDRPVLLWKDRENLQWAALPNPLSLKAMRWLNEQTGDGHIWLRCLGITLEKECPAPQIEFELGVQLEMSGKDRVISWFTESRIKGGISDIHIRVQLTDKEPVGQVSYRHLGVCVKELPDIPIDQFLAAQRYLLTLADRTDSETLYVPYDKQVKVPLPSGQEFSGRLSMVPYSWPDEPQNTAWYSTVIRVLSGKKEILTLRQVAGEHDYDRVRALLDVDAGMVVVSGPTGSGKTTLLASLLSAAYIESPGQRLLTVEDPVEIPIAGAVQFPVEERRELDFDKILRSLLRQDPDILLVGEVRDAEVAAIASRLAVSGHTVYTTVHANYASTVAMRMQSLNMRPDYLAATLRWTTSQRLLNGCCPACSPRSPMPKDPLHRHAALFRTIREVLQREDLPDIVMEHPDADPGCRVCNGEYAPRRLVIESLYWPGLPARATERPEIEMVG